MTPSRTLALKKDVLAELGSDELRGIGGAGTQQTCLCEHPTFQGSCLCTGPCDWSRLC